MEIKKTAQADLEHTRMTGFLLGLILVLAAIFVAFEYTDRVDDEDLSEDMADQLDQDLDMTPLQSQQNRIALMPRTAASSHVSQKIKVVTTDAELPSRQDINPLSRGWLVTAAHINLYYPPEPGKMR